MNYIKKYPLGDVDLKGLCALPIYLNTKLKNKKISQKEISSVVGVTEVILNSRYKEFLRKINFNL